MSKKIKTNLFIKQERKSSRFVVDLKQDIDAPAVKVKKSLKLMVYLKKALSIIKSWLLSISKIKKVNLNIDTNSFKFNFIKIDDDLKEKLNQLAFWNLFELFLHIIKKTYRIISKISYTVGWFFVFITRFIFLLSVKLFSLALVFKNQLSLIIKNKLNYLTGLLKKQSSVTKELISKNSTKFKPQPKLSYLKPVLVFSVILMILILPIKAFTYYKNIKHLGGQVLGASEEAINNLTKGGESISQLSFNEAGNNFSQATNNLLQAEEYLNNVNNLIFKIAAIAPNEDIRLAAISKNIIKAGQYGTQAATETTEAINFLLSPTEESLTEKINNFNEKANSALNNIKNLKLEISTIDPKKLPDKYQEDFVKINKDIVLLSAGLASFLNISDNLADFLGSKQDKRYLLIFQNNAEMRGSGGFIGSYAIIDFCEGKIKNLEVPGGGSYDTEAGLLTNVKAPEPLWLVNPLWHFWDANWWPHWPLSAEKLEWFLEKSDGPTVDGVIAITPTTLERILKIFGEIDLSEDYDMVIDSENLWLKLQTLAEQKPNQTKTPKKIIGDLMIKLIEELPRRINKDMAINLLGALEKSLSEKHILFYFNDKELQSKIEELGWAGEIKDTKWDYLSVINTNIAGGKSDKKIEEQIKHESEIMPNGSIINTVTITRTHNGIKNEPFIGVRNVNWMRIYVPQGSVLMEAHGFKSVDEIYFENPEADWLDDPDVTSINSELEIDQSTGTKTYNELGKTVFANWSQVDPGQSTEIYIKYKLPFNLENFNHTSENTEANTITNLVNFLNPEQKKLQPYSLLIQKQPGSINSSISSKLIFDGKLDVVWKYPKALLVSQNDWNFTTTLNKDRFFSILLSE